MCVALVGSYYVGCANKDMRLLGWISFLASNLMWVLWAYTAGANALLIMQLAFIITSIRGAVVTWRSK